MTGRLVVYLVRDCYEIRGAAGCDIDSVSCV